MTLLGLDVRVTSSAPASNRDPLLYLYNALGGVNGFGDAGDLDNGGNGILGGIGGDANFAYQLSIDVAPQVVPLPGSAALPLAGAALLGGPGQMQKGSRRS